VAIFAATLVTLVFPPAAARWNLVGLLRFLMYFCKESLLAGIQVVRLAFKANLKLRPVVVVYSLRVPSGPARTLFVMMISLLPGTLSAGLDGDKVIVHILSAELNSGLAFLEERVAGLYGMSL
jgi:multicomponent Na+:H+ antiporter subunit E